MVRKSKLVSALDAHKGRDYEAEKRKKQVKAAEKRKKQKSQAVEKDSDLENGHTEDSLKNDIRKILESQGERDGEAADKDDAFEDFSGSDESVVEASSGDNDDDEPSTIPQPTTDEPSASEAEQESDVPLSDLDEDDREDTIPYQRMTINNGPALLASTSRIRLTNPSMRFSAHNSLISSLPPASAAISDPNDDLTRELEFYRICRTAATDARTKLKKEGVPFTRPTDYFAEMAKSDEQMGKVKRKMHEEAASKKASAEARALRDQKKFGKAVQVAKLQERAKEKRETLEKIGSLKRKRKGADTGLVNETDDLFENIDVDAPAKTDRQGRERGAGPGNPKRQKRDEKFGFGGKKRFAKSGDAASTADMRGFSAGRMKGRPGPARGGGGRGGGRGGRGGAQRMGKSRRAAVAR